MTKVLVFDQPEHELRLFARRLETAIPPKLLKLQSIHLIPNGKLTTNGLTKSGFEVYAAR